MVTGVVGWISRPLSTCVGDGWVPGLYGGAWNAWFLVSAAMLNVTNIRVSLLRGWLHVGQR